MSWSPDYAVLCCVVCICSSRQNVSAANVLAASSYVMWMPALQPWIVRYAISSTPFQWHVRCDCSALLFVVMWHWHPFWFGSILDSPALFVMMDAMIGSMIWCCRVEFLLSIWVWCFVFVWLWESYLSFSFLCSSLSGHLVCHFRGRW